MTTLECTVCGETLPNPALNSIRRMDGTFWIDCPNGHWNQIWQNYNVISTFERYRWEVVNFS